MRKVNYWELGFYASLIALTIWLILKVIGVIQTPVWLEYGIPIGSLIIGFLTFYQNIINAIHEVTKGLAVITSRVNHVEEKVDNLNKDMKELKQKF